MIMPTQAQETPKETVFLPPSTKAVAICFQDMRVSFFKGEMTSTRMMPTRAAKEMVYWRMMR